MSETNTTTTEERRREVLARQAEVQAELESLQGARRALAPEVADGQEDAEEKATELAGRIAAARDRIAIYDDALDELSRREEAERVAAEEARLEGLRAEYDALAEKRLGIEERAEEALQKLADVLDELEEVDRDQRALSGQIPDLSRINGIKIDTAFIIGRWLESRLSAHMPGVAPVSDFIKPLPELTPLEIRAPRPASAAAPEGG